MLEEQICKRSILKMVLRPKEGVKPKHQGDESRTKYFVILGVEDDRITVGSVLINSEINQRLFNRIAEHQYRITPEDYPFLSKQESYIDCYSVKEISYERILNEAEFIGTLSEKDFTEVRNIVRLSPTVSKAVLKRFHIK